MARAVRIAAALVVLVSTSFAALAGTTLADRDRASARSHHKVWPRLAYPPARDIRRAAEIAEARGDIAFALIDSSVGLRGYDADRAYSSASVSKALLLAAELRRLERDHEPLDGATKALLEPMITYSDNRAAEAIYARVGDAGLEEVAARAGMRSFQAVPGFWGGDKVTAADLARFFYRLDANLPRRYRRYGKSLLARIAPVERWGIPQETGRGWSIWFKGGWRPAGQEQTSGPVTHQAALLVHRSGERVALAVLTAEAPGAGGIALVEEIAGTLLRRPPPHRGGWLAP
ncbi:MAG TPA: serine hydrolase [Solirubrobacterales bacterium]|nr:serine hydrolase [Solirubrobacterales bacterium]